MVNQLEMTFAALADPTRFQVVAALRGRDLCAGDLARRCAVSGPAMSRHLRVLRKSGLVAVVRDDKQDDDARLRVYRLRPEPFASLREWVDHMQAFWTDQLAAFKAYAETSRRAKGKQKTGSRR